MARRFLLPFGVLGRMGLLASGWVKPGDEFRKATDRAWWSKRYAHHLFPALETYAVSLDRNNLGNGVAFDESLAQGDIASISDKLAMVADDLAVIRASGADVCAPYFIPGRVGVLPPDNLACQTRLNLKPIVDETDRRAREVFGQPIPWWIWVGLGILATKKLSR
jgi:hypothetical protein